LISSSTGGGPPGPVLAFLLLLSVAPIAEAVPPEIPPTWTVLAERMDEEPGVDWAREGDTVPSVTRHEHGGFLSVLVDDQPSVLTRAQLPELREVYLSVRVDADDLMTPPPREWLPDQSAQIVALLDPLHWNPMAAIALHRSPDGRLGAYLEWSSVSGPTHDGFDELTALTPGWHTLTLGVRGEAFIALWVDGRLARVVERPAHLLDRVGILRVGKIKRSPEAPPMGALRFHDLRLEAPRVSTLWVDPVRGRDSSPGVSREAPLGSLGEASRRAGPGTTIHLLPGTYRESFAPVAGGAPDAPLVLRAAEGRGTARLLGSEPVEPTSWVPVDGDDPGLPPTVEPGRVYRADLSGWLLGAPPRFVAWFPEGEAEPVRLHLAREPDWSEDDRHPAARWWMADGGGAAATCSPRRFVDRECDRHARSAWTLTDLTDDLDEGIEPGHLGAFVDLKGATLRVLDTVQGHYAYERRVVGHDREAGRVQVDAPCEHDPGSGNPGLGWGSRYVLEGLPAFLDQPGEWWFDAERDALYLRPPRDLDPRTLRVEVGVRAVGLELTDRAHVHVKDLELTLFEHAALHVDNSPSQRTAGLRLSGCRLAWSDWGVELRQGVSREAPADRVTEDVVIEGCELTHMDSGALYAVGYWPQDSAPHAFARPPMRGLRVRDSYLHHLSFRSGIDSPAGILVERAHDLRIEGCRVEDVAHNGVQLSASALRAGASPVDPAMEDILLGGVLITGCRFERACQLTTDCGGVKLWGRRPVGHVFRDVLITGNLFHDIEGWTDVSEARQRWGWGRRFGRGGFGVYVDRASGAHVHRNVFSSMGHAGVMLSHDWRDGRVVVSNNAMVGGMVGLRAYGYDEDTHGAVDTRAQNNAFVGNEAYGVVVDDRDGELGNLSLDHNLYWANGWGEGVRGGGAMLWHVGDDELPMPGLSELNEGLGWEAHGRDEDPAFAALDVSNNEPPDARPTAASVALIDQGAPLPASLVALLRRFGIQERFNGVVDIGAYEWMGSGGEQ
jgi:hypothetical protein